MFPTTNQFCFGMTAFWQVLSYIPPNLIQNNFLSGVMNISIAVNTFYLPQLQLKIAA